MSDSFNVGDAFIELRLRQEKLEADSGKTAETLRETETRLQGVADKAEKAGEKGNNALGGMVALGLKAITVMGTLELALGAVNVGADLMSGNIEDAAEGLERLPAGIGPVVKQLKDMVGTLTGIKEQTDAILRTTANLEKAMASRLRTTLQGLRQEEELLLNRIKIEQQIALFGTADSDEAARLKVEFNATNRLADARNAANEALREANVLAASTSAETTARALEISEKEEELAKQRKDLAFVGDGSETVAGRIKENIAATTNELRSLEELQAARTADIQGLLDKQQAILETIPLLEKLNEAEKKALEEGIEKQKTEEAKRQSEEMIAIANKQADNDIRIAKMVAEEKKKIAKEQFDESIRLMKEASAEAERQAQQQLDSERRIGDLSTSIRQSQLRAQGRDIEASIDEINSRAEKQSKAAMSDRERELIEQQRRLDVADLIRNAEGGPGGAIASIGSIESAIGNLQAAALKRDDPAMAVRREQVAIAKKQEAHLANIAKDINKPQAAAVGR